MSQSAGLTTVYQHMLVGQSTGTQSVREATYHEGDVDGPEQVHLGVPARLLRNKDEALGVQGEQLGTVLQEGHVLPGSVFPGVEKVGLGLEHIRTSRT